MSRASLAVNLRRRRQDLAQARHREATAALLAVAADFRARAAEEPDPGPWLDEAELFESVARRPGSL